MCNVPRLIDTQEKRIKIECLIAFIHSRITGKMFREEDEDNTFVFSNRYSEKDAVRKGKEIEKALEDIATIDKINDKIKKAPVILANMYNANYSKLSNKLEKLLDKDKSLIEGLIGLHLLELSTVNGMLNYGDNEAIEYYRESIALYENDNYTNDEDVKTTVKRMREVSYELFEFYWKKKGKK